MNSISSIKKFDFQTSQTSFLRKIKLEIIELSDHFFQNLPQFNGLTFLTKNNRTKIVKFEK